ncbi:MAG: methyltransferase domain-containing protein [Anaerolineae bacterium]|nr:methyltransferase domain-containing protein [Anaerolineae bacterium]
MTASGDPSIKLRRGLVKALKEKGQLKDPLVEAAFLGVPRHRFVPDVPLDQAYVDDVVAVKRESDGTVVSSASQPTMVAMMLEQLQLEPGHNVLEIGAGTGYNAALIQHIIGNRGTVTTIDVDPEMVTQAQNNLQRALYGQVRVVQGDGASGYSPRASYDRIIATVGVWDIPLAWVTQLKPRGLIVAPLWLNAFQVSGIFHLENDDSLYSENNVPCGFIRLRGVDAGPVVTQRVGNSALMLTTNSAALLDSAALHLLFSEDAETSLLDTRLDANEYWQGLLPYLILHVPDDYAFAVYHVGANQQVYGIEGHGFAFITQGSACFVPYNGHGEVNLFGGSDAIMALQSLLTDWDDQGRPGSDQLRLRLIPVDAGEPHVEQGIIYRRKGHYLHVWQEI